MRINLKQVALLLLCILLSTLTLVALETLLSRAKRHKFGHEWWLNRKAVIRKKPKTSVSAARGRPDCAPLRYGANAFPLTALISCPGSGSTWTRHLIQQLTGYYTGSIYCDGALHYGGFPGECVHNSSVIAIKTHNGAEETHPIGRTFDKAILLIRDPAEAVIAWYNFEKGGGHTARAVKIGGKEWEQFVNIRSSIWHALTTDWIKTFKGPLLLVRFIDLKLHLKRELKRIADFLNVHVSEARLRCVLGNAEGNFRRDVVETVDPLTPKMHVQLASLRDDVEKIIREKHQMKLKHKH